MTKEKRTYESKSKMSSLKLTSLLEVTKAINNNASIKELLQTFEHILKNQLNIGKLALYNFNTKWECILTYGLNKDFSLIDAEKDLLKFKEISIVDDKLHNMFEVIIPVYHKQHPLAFVLIGDLDDDKLELSPVIKHLPFIQTLTNVIIVAIENKRLYKEAIKQIAYKKEMELASQMQNMLFPESLPKNESLNFDAIYLPHQEVGGDYYDFIWINENEFVFCIADVSGKGLAAALLMSNFQANLRTLTTHTNNLTNLIIELNTKVMASAKGEKFITLFVASYNINTRTLKYINAGQNPPILLQDKSVTLLRDGCTGLGMFDELNSIQAAEIQLKPNSLLFCYTDGIIETENENNEYFGIQRLTTILKQFQEKKPEEINKELISSIIKFKGTKGYTDDIAVFLGRIT